MVTPTNAQIYACFLHIVPYIYIMKNCVCGTSLSYNLSFETTITTLQLSHGNIRNQNKLSCYKFTMFYYSCILVLILTHIQMISHHIYSFGQSCLTLLTSCMKVMYDNYNTNGMNEALINNFFAIILQPLYWIFVQLLKYQVK